MPDDRVLTAIQSDFAVDLLAHGQDQALFGAMRRDVWHFVYWQAAPHANPITQYHVPRFVVADVLDVLIEPVPADAQRPQAPSDWELLWHDLGIRVLPGKRFALNVLQTSIDLPPAYVDAMLADLDVLIGARNLVKAQGDLYLLPTQETHHGNRLAHPAKKLMEAIAFEGEVRGELDAQEFALYSAFCTMSDFSHDEQISLAGARSAVQFQFGNFEPQDLPEDVLDAVSEVQDALFPERLWGWDIALDREMAAEILAEGFTKLNEEQRSQYVLLSGMYNAGVCAVLAAILGFLPFERYAQFMTQGLAPDSEDEQAMRTDIAFIELFGQLAR